MSQLLIFYILVRSFRFLFDAVVAADVVLFQNKNEWSNTHTTHNFFYQTVKLQIETHPSAPAMDPKKLDRSVCRSSLESYAVFYVSRPPSRFFIWKVSLLKNPIWASCEFSRSHLKFGAAKTIWQLISPKKSGEYLYICTSSPSRELLEFFHSRSWNLFFWKQPLWVGWRRSGVTCWVLGECFRKFWSIPLNTTYIIDINWSLFFSGNLIWGG